MTKYAKTYAGALYDLAAEEGKEDVILQDLQLFCDSLKEMPEYRKLLSTPAVPKEERKELVKQAWGEALNQYTMNFICMLCDGNAISEILDCEEEFKNRYNADKGIAEVTVTSAVALSDSQKTALIAAVEKKIGKKVVLNEKTDPSIIGGLKLSAAGREYDGSIAYHLNSIAALLSGNN